KVRLRNYASSRARLTRPSHMPHRRPRPVPSTLPAQPSPAGSPPPRYRNVPRPTRQRSDTLPSLPDLSFAAPVRPHAATASLQSPACRNEREPWLDGEHRALHSLCALGQTCLSAHLFEVAFQEGEIIPMNQQFILEIAARCALQTLFGLCEPSQH